MPAGQVLKVKSFGWHPREHIEDGWVVAQSEPIVAVSALRMPGEHNQQNLLMAVAARLAGIERCDAKLLPTFPVFPIASNICTWQGIDFINDSKATNDAAQVGLASVNSPVLIAGGEAKAGDDKLDSNDSK